VFISLATLRTFQNELSICWEICFLFRRNKEPCLNLKQLFCANNNINKTINFFQKKLFKLNNISDSLQQTLEHFLFNNSFSWSFFLSSP